VIAEGPNAEQIRYWNETSGPKWVQLQEFLDAHIESLGRVAMDRLAPASGEVVLEIGCGCGSTTLELARRVGPSGHVVGIDISAVMLDRARELAGQRGADNVRFENADAQTHAFAPASFDALYSRFGVMFFAAPEAAFANLRAALRAGGRVGFVCWRAVTENPWMMVPMMAALQHVQFPPPPPPGAPGPFSFADADRVRAVLVAAGFESVTVDPHDEKVRLGGSIPLDQAVEFVLQMGPTGSALREVAPEVRDRVAVAVREALTPYETPLGVEMDAAVWIVSARNRV